MCCCPICFQGTTASSVRPFYSPNLIFLFSFPLSVSWSCPFPRTQTLSWSTTWMCQLSRIVGSHVGPSCAPSIQTRKNGPNGQRRNSLASWNPCVSVQSHSINWMHNLSLLMHVLSDHCKQCLKKYHYQTAIQRFGVGIIELIDGFFFFLLIWCIYLIKNTL